MNTKQIILYGSILAVILTLLSYNINTSKLVVAPLGGPGANRAGEPVDLIGTQTGTTTASVYFFETAATTTYPFRIGPNTNTVTLTLEATNASTTGSYVSLNLLASNDYDCNTASTTTIYDVPLVEQIRWYDAAYSFLREFAGSLTLPAATTTISWAPTTGQSRTINLTNVNAKCLAVAIQASSTSLHAQFISK